MTTAPTYPIRTDRLILRPLEEGDLQDMNAYQSRPEVVRYLYWETRTLEETREDLAKKLSRTELKEEGDALSLGIVLVESNTLIGEISFFWQSKEHKQGEIGFIINPDYQGGGYATEAARAVLDFAFQEFDMHRICARCDARNVGSYRLMERLGMRREAHFIENEIFKGDWGDEFVYAILQSEWGQA